MVKRKRKYRALQDCYIGNEKRPSIRKGQKWIVSGLCFSENAESVGFISTWICKRMGTECFLHKDKVVETFGKEVLEKIDMKVDIK